MKKNLPLFLILVAMLTATYFFEELEGIKERAKNEKKITLIKSKTIDLKSIQFNNFKLIKKGDSFFVQKYLYPVDPKILDAFFSTIGNLRVKRYFTEEEISSKRIEHFVAHNAPKIQFTFKNESIEFMLGEKLNFNRSFYLKVKRQKQTQIVEAFNIAPGPTLYTQKNDINNPAAYIEMQKIFSLPLEYFLKKNLIDNDFQISSLSISSSRRPTFSANFDSTATTPPVIQGIKYDYNFFKKVKSQLSTLQAKKILFADTPPKIESTLSTIRLTSTNNESITLKLFQKYNGKLGHYLSISKQKEIFTLSRTSAKIFFTNIQDFWDKKILDELDLFGKKDEYFEISSDTNTTIKLRLPFSKKFEVEVIDNKKINPKRETWRDLFTLLTGISPRTKAYRVSASSPQNTFDKRLQHKKGIYLKFKNFLLRLTHINDELIVSNLTKGFNLHYLVGNKSPISTQLYDYFE